MTLPLVSCLMPTYNRRPFLARAIGYFQRQSYANRELIVIDDGTDAIGDLIPPDSAIRYERLPGKLTLGEKLNLGCEMARGAVIAHFDDDDWYAPWRLAYQVNALLRDGTDLCGINQLLYYDIPGRRGYEYRYPKDQRTWLAGSDLLYSKDYWRTHHFVEINVGMDGLFCWSAERDRITVLDDRDFAVHMIHPANGSAKQVEDAYWRPHPVEEIARVIGEDWVLYEPLADRGGSQAPAGPRARAPAMPRSSHEAAPPTLRNVFACLVHEKPDCVVDLVSNLRRLDPHSRILLYDGSGGALLDSRLPWARWGAELCRHPRPMRWGRLHGFALDCLRHLGSEAAFDLLTVVDSDQLALRPGYSEFMSRRIGDRSGLGLLTDTPGRQGPRTTIAPCMTAYNEIDLWRPFLRRFAAGEDKFVHWSFWPSTVFTAEAGMALVDLFDRDVALREILDASRLWATEEVLLPTLVALLGLRIEQNPCAGDFVKYRLPFNARDVEAAWRRSDVFWMHPVTRSYADPARARIRQEYEQYRMAPPPAAAPCSPPLLSPILQRMRMIEGWLEDAEAELLAIVARELFMRDTEPKHVVEIGCYCGRATAVLAAIAQACSPRSRILAIDTFDGVVGALDTGLIQREPSLPAFKRMLAETGFAAQVDIAVGRAAAAACARPVDLLLVDGLHDYANVAQDFHAFAASLSPSALAAFHDYAPYFPGVRRFVDELLAEGTWARLAETGTLIVLCRTGSPV